MSTEKLTSVEFVGGLANDDVRLLMAMDPQQTMTTKAYSPVRYLID